MSRAAPPSQGKRRQPGGETFGSEPRFDQPFYMGFNMGGHELGLPPGDMPGESKSVTVSVVWGVENIESEFKRL